MMRKAHDWQWRGAALALSATFALVALTFVTVVGAPAGAAYEEPPAPVPGLLVQGAWARAAAKGMNSAVYFTLQNSGEDDVLVGAASDVAVAVEVHRTTMEGGVMRMHPVGPVPIPAGGSVELKPGGLHVMLIELRDDLIEGTEIAIILEFERAGPMTLSVPVRPLGSM